MNNKFIKTFLLSISLFTSFIVLVLASTLVVDTVNEISASRLINIHRDSHIPLAFLFFAPVVGLLLRKKDIKPVKLP